MKNQLIILCVLQLVIASSAKCLAVPNANDTTTICYCTRCHAVLENGMHVSHRDYTPIAKRIVKGCTTDFDKAKAIYKWLCDSIVYDYSLTICSPDVCYEKKKGICNAYSELFCLLAKAVGVRAEKISGKSKDTEGEISKIGHAWVIVYVGKNRTLLCDPTWGAGGVDVSDTKKSKNNWKKLQSLWKKSRNCWEWFDVPPCWMIFTHYPDEAKYQLLPEPMAEEEFLRLNPVSNCAKDYIQDVQSTSDSIRVHYKTRFPVFYDSHIGDIEIIEYPQNEDLRIGDTYTFKIRLKKKNIAFALHIDNNWILEKEWEKNDGWIFDAGWVDEGDGVYSINYTPTTTGTLGLYLGELSEKKWFAVMSYQVKTVMAYYLDNLK